MTIAFFLPIMWIVLECTKIDKKTANSKEVMINDISKLVIFLYFSTAKIGRNDDKFVYKVALTKTDKTKANKVFEFSSSNFWLT